MPNILPSNNNSQPTIHYTGTTSCGVSSSEIQNPVDFFEEKWSVLKDSLIFFVKWSDGEPTKFGSILINNPFQT